MKERCYLGEYMMGVGLPQGAAVIVFGPTRAITVKGSTRICWPQQHTAPASGASPFLIRRSGPRTNGIVALRGQCAGGSRLALENPLETHGDECAQHGT